MIEKNIVDRVPKYAGRIKLTPVSGQADLFTMTRADEPTVEGTPLDKATLDSIIKSRLTGRYYVPTISQETLINQTGVTVSPVPTSWTRVTDNEYVSGNYKITSSTQRAGGGDIYNAFDGLNDTSWSSTQNSTTDFVMIELPTPITVKRIKMRCYAVAQSGGGEISTITVQGSNNGTSWENLRSVSGGQTAVSEYQLTTTGAYKFYRLLISRTGTTIVGCSAFEFSLYDISTYSNKYTLTAGVPVEWTINQKLTIQTPVNVVTVGTQGNTLNGVGINAILQPARKYELVYNGSAFDVKEV